MHTPGIGTDPIAAAFLDDRSALVTGASRNLGAVICEELAARGATVVVNYHRSTVAAEALVQRLRDATGRPHIAVAADVTRAEEISRLVAAANDATGGVDILVNNAGPFVITPFSELPEAEFDRVFDANVKAAYLAARALVPSMRERGWGRIVNVGAISSDCRNHSVYGLAKAALAFLTEELAVELGPEIRVNVVAPGQIVESVADITEHDPTFVERALRTTPTRRLVTRAEVAALVAAICGPLFDGVTGATIPVDGGFRFPRY